MDKKEAAELLGVSVRAIERYCQAGKLTCRYVDAERGGKRAIFARVDLLKLKKAMAQANGNGARPRHSDTSPARQGVMVSRSIKGREIEARTEYLMQLIRSGGQLGQEPAIRATEKLTLTLAEASALSGLSIGFLRDAIREGKLRGIRGAGRGWRVRRVDLEGFVNEL